MPLDRLFTRAEITTFTQMVIKMVENQLIQLPEEDPEVEAGFSPKDYNLGTVETTGNWITPDQLRIATQKMTEAMKVANYTEGFMLAVQIITFLRP